MTHELMTAFAASRNELRRVSHSATCGSRIFGSFAVDLTRQKKSSTKSSAKEGKDDVVRN
jgi:hypothetical protein